MTTGDRLEQEGGDSSHTADTHVRHAVIQLAVSLAGEDFGKQ